MYHINKIQYLCFLADGQNRIQSICSSNCYSLLINACIISCSKNTVWEVERSNMIEVRKCINSEARLGCSCHFVWLLKNWQHMMEINCAVVCFILGQIRQTTSKTISFITSICLHVTTQLPLINFCKILY